MFTLDMDDFVFELKDGALKHVGPSNRTATAKLYDVAVLFEGPTCLSVPSLSSNMKSSRSNVNIPGLAAEPA